MVWLCKINVKELLSLFILVQDRAKDLSWTEE